MSVRQLTGPSDRGYRQSTRSAWFVRFLLRFPTPAAIPQLDRESFSAEAWDLLGRKVSKRAKLEESYSAAAETIGLPVPLDSPAIETFRLQLARYAELNQQCQQLDRRAQELLAGNSDFYRLQTLPGAAILALTILAEAGDLRRFHHHRQFLRTINAFSTSAFPVDRFLSHGPLRRRQPRR